MKNLKLLPIITVLSLSSLLSGCSEETKPVEPTHQPPIQESKENLHLQTILSKDTASENKQTPSQAVLHQIEWELSNAETVIPTEENVSWSATFLSTSVVVLKLPLPAPSFNMVFLSHQGGDWIMQGIADMTVNSEADANAPSSKIDLPMKNYTSAKLTFGTEEQTAWGFANAEKQIVIGKFPHATAFSLPEHAQSVRIKDFEGWYLKDNPQSALLYYIDRDQVVWIAGNITETELLTLANSLPASTFHNFPFASP